MALVKNRGKSNCINVFVLRYGEVEVMANEVIKTLAEKIKVLSPEQQEKVLEFVENLEPKRRTLWDMWKEELKDIPEEEWDDVPTDASVNLDHYLYGAPKK